MQNTKQFENLEKKPSLKKRLKKKKGLVGVFSAFIKYFDFYGEEIRLTYKGDSRYKTTTGGVVSLILLGLILLYSVTRVTALI